MNLNFDRVAFCRMETGNLGSMKGMATVSLYNGNKKTLPLEADGALGFDCDGFRQTVRFKRKIGEEIWSRGGESLFDAIEFGLQPR